MRVVITAHTLLEATRGNEQVRRMISDPGQEFYLYMFAPDIIFADIVSEASSTGLEHPASVAEVKSMFGNLLDRVKIITKEYYSQGFAEVRLFAPNPQIAPYAAVAFLYAIKGIWDERPDLIAPNETVRLITTAETFQSTAKVVIDAKAKKDATAAVPSPPVTKLDRAQLEPRLRIFIQKYLRDVGLPVVASLGKILPLSALPDLKEVAAFSTLWVEYTWDEDETVSIGIKEPIPEWKAIIEGKPTRLEQYQEIFISWVIYTPMQWEFTKLIHFGTHVPPELVGTEKHGTRIEEIATLRQFGFAHTDLNEYIDNILLLNLKGGEGEKATLPLDISPLLDLLYKYKNTGTEPSISDKTGNGEN